MTWNPKALGLALVAAFAFCGVAASGASGDQFTAANGGPITLTGSQEEHSGLLDELNLDAGEVVCETIHYAGTMAKTPATEVTLKPEFSKCFAAEIIPALFDTNKCGFKFTINPVAGKTDGWLDIECEKEAENITITVNTPNTVKCTIHITQQTLGGVTYTNLTGGKITIRVNATGIKYTETTGTGLGACPNHLEDTGNGTYNGAAIIEGTEDECSLKAVEVSVS